MSSLLTPGWIVAILGLLVPALSVALNRLKAREGPVWGIRAVQAVLILLSALMIYSLYLQFTR